MFCSLDRGPEDAGLDGGASTARAPSGGCLPPNHQILVLLLFVVICYIFALFPSARGSSRCCHLIDRVVAIWNHGKSSVAQMRPELWPDT